MVCWLAAGGEWFNLSLQTKLLKCFSAPPLLLLDFKDSLILFKGQFAHFT